MEGVVAYLIRLRGHAWEAAVRAIGSIKGNRRTGVSLADKKIGAGSSNELEKIKVEEHGRKVCMGGSKSGQ
jgi:hypothetical protein